MAYVLLPDDAMLNEQLQKESKKEKRGLWKKAKPSDWSDWYRRRHDPDKKNWKWKM